MGCPGFIIRECSASAKGKYLIDARLVYNVDTKEICVERCFASLKDLAFNGGIYPPANKSYQTFAFDTKEDYEFFSNSNNFVNSAEWYKAMLPYLFAPHQFSEPLPVFLDRISNM